MRPKEKKIVSEFRAWAGLTGWRMAQLHYATLSSDEKANIF
jgi:hypothetical protein